MPPGRRFGLGRACAPPFAPNLQHLLSVYGEWHRGGRSFAGRFLAGLPDSGELPVSAWRVCNVGDERDAKLADRSLPADETGPGDRFAGRCDAGGGKQGVGGTATGRAGTAGRAERASAEGVDQAFGGIAGGRDFEGLAT